MTFKSIELDKTFESEKELFTALRKNKKEIINLKKKEVLFSCKRGQSISVSNKVKFVGAEKDLQLDEKYEYIAVNTAKILDSHKDLHVNGIWNKTVREQQGKNYLVMDHKLEMSKTIVKKEDIEMFVAEVPFSALGKAYFGSTQALIYKFEKTKVINDFAKEWIESGSGIEASVRMQYVDIKLAMNSQMEEDEEEYKTYLQYVDQIANKTDFESIDYFWVVKEAKNIAESSLVLQGSNPVTGNLKMNIEPSDDTHKQEPPTGTPEKSLNYNFLNNNFKLD